MIKKTAKQITEKFERINIEFEKFFASKILGRKYLRQGQCKCCGRCCQRIYVRHSSAVIKDEEQFEKLKSEHFFYSYIKVVGKDELGLIFECTKLDKEKGVCTAYKHRALICRQYPQEEVFMMGGVISDDCGYKFIPIRSFEEVFSKVKKNQGNKQVEFHLDSD